MPASLSAGLRGGLREILVIARKKLRTAIITVVAAWLIAYLSIDRIILFLAQPLEAAMRRRFGAELAGTALNYGSLSEPFWTELGLSFWCAIALASPVLFFQVWRVVSPRLPASKRRLGIPFAIFTALFFVGGIAFGYAFVLAPAFDFFLGYATQVDVPLTPALFVQPYIQLVSRMLVAFGVAFELPVILTLLSWLGVIGSRALWRFNRYAVVIAFVVAALLTPGPDVLSQLMLALPLVVLYNLSIAVAWLIERSRRQDAQQRESQPPR